MDPSSDSNLAPEGLRLLWWFIAFTFLLNIRSWPFAWHLRVFQTAIPLKIMYLYTKFRLMISPIPSKSKIEAKSKLLERLSPVGANPFDYSVTHRSRAYIDDCDFHFHMSNSSYSKAVDAAILKFIPTSFPTFCAAGGYLPLTGSTFHFYKPINMLVKYDVQVRIAAWDQKWLYFVSKFVTQGKTSIVPVADQLLYASESLNDGASSDTSGPSPNESKSHLDRDKPNAIAISRLCFKIGRITVPPALVLGISGFCSPSLSTPAYSHKNPPPHWPKVWDLANHLEVDEKNLRIFLTRDWKEVAPENRWWEQALARVDERRKEGLKHANQLLDIIQAFNKLLS